MSRTTAYSSSSRRAVLAVVLWAGCCVARADDLTLRLEPRYTIAYARSTDQTGAVVSSTTQRYSDNYRLSLTKDLYPNVRFSSTAVFNHTATLEPFRANSEERAITADLGLGDQVLGWDARYDRRESAGTGREIYELSSEWNPAELPRVSTRLSRTNQLDTRRSLTLKVQDAASLDTRYLLKFVDLGYSLLYTDTSDPRTGGSAQTLNQTFTAGMGGNKGFQLFGGRTRLTLGASLSGVGTRANSANQAGGFLTEPRVPAAGLSIIESFPATPQRVTLAANPALVDGNTAASANVSLGFSRTLAGDVAFRDLGARFDEVSARDVNTAYVWVDKQLPPAVASAFEWAVFRSDDNLIWTAVGITQPVAFGAFDNRFEISFEKTESRYLKIVTRPLRVAVTTDPAFSDISVTELQLLLTGSPDALRRSSTSSTVTNSANAAASTVLVRAVDLNHLLSVSVARTVQPSGPTRYSVTNGLSAARRLSPIASASAQATREDSGTFGGTHTGSNSYGASLSLQPLPTLSHGLTYGGTLQSTSRGWANSNSFALSNTAQLYEGIALAAVAGLTLAKSDVGDHFETRQTSTQLSLNPYPSLTVQFAYAFGDSASSSSTGRTYDKQSAVTSSVSWAPFPTVALSFSVTKDLARPGRPLSLGAGSVSVSPFSGGALTLNVAYARSADFTADTTAQSLGASLRWRIRAATYFDATFGQSSSTAPTGTSFGRTFTSGLVVLL